MNGKPNYMIVEASFGEETCTSDKICAIGGADKFYFEEVFIMKDIKKIKKYYYLENFISEMLNISEDVFGQGFDSIAITFIDGRDDTFIWGIDVNPDEENFSYGFIDWRKEGKRFKYLEE